MRRLLFGLLLIAIASAVCIWRLPASVALAALPASASSVVRLHQVNGTVWAGSAQLSVQHVPPAIAISWTCRPALAPFGIACELRDSVAGRVGVALFERALTAQQLTATVPLQIQAAGVALGGSPRVAVNIADLSLNQTQLSLKAVARADDTVWRFGQVEMRLGELSLDCVPAADRASASCALSNRGGDARLDGKATLTPQRASGSIELTPANGPVQRFAF